MRSWLWNEPVAYALNNSNLVIARFEARTLFCAQVSYAFVRFSEYNGDIREAKEVGVSSGEHLK